MPQINQDSLMAVQPELTSGESVLWAGQPNPRIIFHKDDLYLIPFSLLWGGFAIFWEAGVSGYWGSGPNSGKQWVFGMLWGIPFVLVGQYMIWGRFLYAAWKKKRTHYAVTERRVVVVQNGWKRQMASAFVDTLPDSNQGRRFQWDWNFAFRTGRIQVVRETWMGSMGWLEHRKHSYIPGYRRCGFSVSTGV